MNGILLYSAVVSFILWSWWNSYNKRIMKVYGYQYWYRSIYLRMPSWRFARLVKFFWSGRKCKVCKTTWNIDVHHRFYMLGKFSVLYWEWLLPFVLQVLCRKHHTIIHDKELN